MAGRSNPSSEPAELAAPRVPAPAAPGPANGPGLQNPAPNSAASETTTSWPPSLDPRIRELLSRAFPGPGEHCPQAGVWSQHLLHTGRAPGAEGILGGR